MTGLDNSIAVLIANKISDYAEKNVKSHILDELSIYGGSEKDGSAVMCFEWHGDENNVEAANEVLEFLSEIKNLVKESGKEVAEQVSPHALTFRDRERDIVSTQVIYRFRIWPETGNYEEMERKIVSK